LFIEPDTSLVFDFTYSTPICNNSQNILPNLEPGFLTGGYFSSTSGLSLNSESGEINSANSQLGTYTIYYSFPSNPCPALNISSFEVSIIPPLNSQTNFSYTSPICSGSPNQFPILPPGFTSGGFFSSSSGLEIDSITGEINVLTSITGTYSITYSTQNVFCVLPSTSTFTVLLYPTPGATINYPQNPFCSNSSSETIEFSGIFGGNFSSDSGLNINNTTGEVNPSLSTIGAHTINYFVNQLNGCPPVSASTNIYIYNFPTASILGSNEICQGQLGVFNVQTTDSILWNTGQTTASITSDGTAGTVVSVVVFNSGCIARDSLVISNVPLPIVNASASEYSIILGKNTQLFGSSNSEEDSLFWNPQSFLSCIDCLNPFAAPTDTIIYFLTSINKYGCKSIDSVKIMVNTNCDEFFVPNMFSPNGDNSNDEFCLFGTNCIIVLNFVVYDRWGNLVFKTNDPDFCWDGNYNGKPLDSGVFVYQLDASTIKKEIINKTGNITLVR
jgi:gliding motility-associated-like protein